MEKYAAKFKMNKKAQGLPLNLIIIAVIVLIVLAVIIAIFVGKIRVLPTGVQSCEGRGGSCQEKSCASLGLAPILNHDCKQREDPKDYCCIDITGVSKDEGNGNSP